MTPFESRLRRIETNDVVITRVTAREALARLHDGETVGDLADNELDAIVSVGHPRLPDVRLMSDAQLDAAIAAHGG